MTKKIAAILTEYRRYSHADVIVGKFLKGFPTDDGMIQSRVQIVSMYVDQFPDSDLSRGMSEKYNVPIYGSIPQALTLGGDKLAVDGILIIGEHGDYAWNEKEQHLYPRKYFMEQVCGVLATSGRSVPIFNDKHLSYNWADAKWMYDRAKALNAPYMAGSSLPVGYRNPWLEHELDTPIQEALAIGYSGLDVYGFHTLETLQCMVERRKGGETGVKSVTCLEGDAVWQAAAEGRWPRDLAEAGRAQLPDHKDKPLEEIFPNPAVFIIEYRDGFRGTVIMHPGPVTDGDLKGFAYAARINNEIQACEVFLGGDPHPHFSYLSLNVEEMFVTGQPTWPVERTLLTTGILEAALDSRYRGHVTVETPYLDIAYRSYDRVPWRPTGPRPNGAAATPWPA
jgi:hypothetical protein